MNLPELTQRERDIFLSIVHCFIETAEPVGSRHLARRYNFSLSPATIRNVMTDLEEKGLIYQPHTSAGRVPTDLGYRQYVNNLANVTELSDDEKRRIIEPLKSYSQNIDQILMKASQVLGRISSQLGVVLSPRFTKGRLDKIELVDLSNDKLLVILGIRSGLVKTVIVEMEHNVPRNVLDQITRQLNERLHGVPIDILLKSMDERFTDLDKGSRMLLQIIKERTRNVLNEGTSDLFHLSGAVNVISQPEFETRDKVGTILELLDRKDILIHILNERESEGVSIVIGEENEEALMKNCSLITTTYRFKDSRGTLGVIGPTRMQYEKIIALVQYMAETLGYLVNRY